MILVAGLTPAWQQIVVLDRLQTGEVNRARRVIWCASGKVLNVGLGLTQLGAVSQTLSMVGSGSTGEATRRDFEKLGSRIEWIKASATQRACTTLLDEATSQTTEIVENSPAATPDELQLFRDAFARLSQVSSCDLIILSGSLPQEAPRDFFASLLKNTPNRAILDIRGPELRACLTMRPFIVKPNREELAQTVGRPLTNNLDLIQAMSEMHELGARWVIVTDGPNEVFVSCGDREHLGQWRLTPPQVSVVNPIGCGDGFTAGIAFAMQRGDEMLDAIRFGVAAAAYNATQLLPARFELQAVASLLGQVSIASTAR